mmetsp:Transcript_62323/g.124890  ORF Transcript_62323/g.124890 Transcript_62323/m.124890 type:complete len:88 (+) Transcript_62323:367-630(+)
MYVAVLNNLMEFTNEELTVHQKNRSQEFQDWSNDVGIFFATRLVLFGKAIPITEKNVAAAKKQIASSTSAGAAAEDASIQDKPCSTK